MDAAYGEAYARLYAQHFWWRARERFLLEVIDALAFPRGGNVLDVGCGDGLFFRSLARYGRVCGVESDGALVSPDSVQRSAIHIGPFDESYNPRQRFSLILMLDVLEHLTHPERALRHALSLLNPEGAIVVTVPAFNLLWTRHDDLNHHYLRYTRERFCDLAQRAGMRVDRAQYFFHWMFVAKLAERLRERHCPGPAAPARVPHALINRCAYGISRLEQRIFSNHPLPFGSSLLVTGGHKVHD